MEKGLIVAITGQSGCGKSTLSAYYAAKGFTVIDCDEVAAGVHKNVDCLVELQGEFGTDIVSGGMLDKKLLVRRAFATQEKLQRLTDITHPYIIKEILSQADTAFKKGDKYVFVDGAVIIGHAFEKYCDKYIVVVSSEKLQQERISARDGITTEQAEERLNGQTPYSQMLKKADYVINNNSSVTELILQGEYVLKQLLKRGGEENQTR